METTNTLNKNHVSGLRLFFPGLCSNQTLRMSYRTRFVLGNHGGRGQQEATPRVSFRLPTSVKLLIAHHETKPTSSASFRLPTSASSQLPAKQNPPPRPALSRRLQHAPECPPRTTKHSPQPACATRGKRSVLLGELSFAHVCQLPIACSGSRSRSVSFRLPTSVSSRLPALEAHNAPQ